MPIIRVANNYMDYDGGDAIMWSGSLNGYIAPNVTTALDMAALDGHRYIEGFDLTEFWFSIYWRRGGNSGNASIPYIKFMDMRDDTVEPLYRVVQVTSSSVALDMRLANGTWQTIGTITGITGSNLVRCDIRIVMNDTTGVIEYYRDGVLVDSFSGNTNPRGATGINRIQVQRPQSQVAESSNNRIVYSGLILSSEDTREMTIVERVPTANGDEFDWSGSYADVTLTQATVVPTTFIETESGQNRALVQYASLSAFAAQDPVAVSVGAAARGGPGATLRPTMRTSGDVNRDGDAKIVGGVDWSGARHIFNDNNGSPWSYSDWEGGQIGVIS